MQQLYSKQKLKCVELVEYTPLIFWYGKRTCGIVQFPCKSTAFLFFCHINFDISSISVFRKCRKLNHRTVKVWLHIHWFVNFCLQYYLSQISPTSSNKLELDGIMLVNSGKNNCCHVAKSSISSELDTDEHDLFVHVDNPEKHVTAMETYITFRVITKVGYFLKFL